MSKVTMVTAGEGGLVRTDNYDSNDCDCNEEHTCCHHLLCCCLCPCGLGKYRNGNDHMSLR